MLVTLVGAGPGDKGLLTLKGAQRILEADVILHDRFVGPEIMAMLPESAEIIDVGKYVGNHPVPQEEINKMLVEKAKEGKNVVRLKGGDPFVFGRGGEELELLVENNIPFEVVPGVTSAISGPAYAGIPVTHRDYASSFHIITGHARNNEPTNIDFEALVRTGGTLVFLMGVSSLKSICEGCISAGMDKDMPAAVVENATYNNQRKFVGTVSTLPSIAEENSVVSPSLIIVGKVCELSMDYDWISGRPLHGKSIIVARASPGTSRLSDNLRELGAQVFEMPSPKIVPLTEVGSDIRMAIEEIDSFSWLVFTSAVGVNTFFDCISEMGLDIRELHHLNTACVGAETARELKKRGINSDYNPDEYNGVALAQGLSELVNDGDKLLITRAKDGAEDLTKLLTDAKIQFEDVAIYDKELKLKEVVIPETQYAAFTSSSAVQWFSASIKEVDLSKIKAICIGKSTAEKAMSYGMETIISEKASIDSLVTTIKELLI
ncbi:MAG: uroporphyrinogen-III C-methyltransferase [Oscillospiraceae bacterium]|nr:uroporphyrinogen-III C-methyltransferase [Oscillospiraceae bacterium]